jgi:hypothetical protein
MGKPLFFLLLTAVLLGTPSCKKYQDGPYIHYQTRKSRLKGSWELESVTTRMQQDITSLYSGYQLHFERREDSIRIEIPGLGFSPTGTWDLVDDKEALGWILDTIPITFPFLQSDTLDILRLTGSEFWFVDREFSTFKWIK